MRVVKTWGYARKGLVPDIPGTTPKACSKCGHWFAAGKWQRKCENCSEPRRRAEREAKGNHTRASISRPKLPGHEVLGKHLDPLVRATLRNIREGHQDRRDLEIAERAAAKPLREVKFISHACSSPKEPQAEVAACDRDRRHPYNGKRPQNSGYCVVLDCACKCHRRDDEVVSSM